MGESLITTLDALSETLEVNGVIPSRSDTARQLLEFAISIVLNRSPKITALLNAVEDELFKNH